VNLYLAHHGDAVAADVDPQRPLSEHGRLTVQWVALEAARRDARPGIIWHSGKLRARQTAEEFRRACNPLADFSAARGLQPSDPPEWIRDRLLAESGEIMIVGHMPHLPRLLQLLLSSPGSPSPDAAFPPHGVVALEHGTSGWIERWRVEA
jgi:phosphohistidine phosphatase